MANYQITKFRGIGGEELVVHMCCPSGKNMVEVWTTGATVLSKEQFEQMIAWVNQQFEILSKEVHTIH